MFSLLRLVNSRTASNVSLLRHMGTSAAATAHSHAHPELKIRRTEALINNNWVKSKKTFQTINPANEETLAEVTYCGKHEVDAAVEAANAAFYGGDWSKLGGYERGRLLNRLADLIEKNKEELILLEVLDNGKTIGEATAADMNLVLQCYRYYAGWADKIHGAVVNPSGPVAGRSHYGVVEREPVGVVGQIIPWNFPLLMQAWKLGPALATGCTVVLKPAEQTPLSALRIGELAIEAGFPAGAINIIPGDGETGKLLVHHPKVDKLAFTGSTEVGLQIMKHASKDLKRVTLELGGKSPVVVCEDADLDRAVATSHVGLFLNQGQCCCAGSRIFVHESVYDKFVQKSVELAKSRRVGPGWDRNSQQGPQVSKEQHDKILGYIKSGQEQGAKLMTGGKQVGKKGFFIEPTVFADVEDHMTIAKEEIFGPVMSILKFKDYEEVIKRANSTEYGLGAAIFTKSFSTAQKLSRRIRSGTVWINCYDVFDAALPFGGFKQSGLGRELGEAGLAPYLEYKTVVHSLE